MSDHIKPKAENELDKYGNIILLTPISSATSNACNPLAPPYEIIV